MSVLPYIKDRDKYILGVCQGKNVLHIGCVDFPLTEEKIRSNSLLHGEIIKVAKKVVGIDLDEPGIEQLKQLYPSEDFYACNAESFDSRIGNDYDVFLAADVIEHVSNPGRLLDSISQIMCAGSRLVITTPSAFSVKKFLCALFLRREHNHPHHTFFFSPMTIERLASLHGLRVINISTFQWKNPTLRNKLVNFLLIPFITLSGNWVADEIAVEFERM